MKELTAFTLLFFTLGCFSMKKMQRIRLKFKDNDTRHTLVFYIPRGYSLQRIEAGAEAGLENRYWYKDSSVIYVSDFRGSSSLNYANIRKQEGSYAKKFEADTITLSGINESGKYWKEVKYKQLYYGYSNATTEEKTSFDQALSSVKVK